MRPASPTTLLRPRHRLRELVDRVGGTNAITSIAFWVTFAQAVLVHLTAGLPTQTNVGLRIVIVVTAQLLAFSILLPIRAAVVRAGRPLPWLVLTGFVAYGAVRGLVLDAGLTLFGAEGVSHLVFHIVAGTVNATLALIITALVIDTARENAARLAALAAANASLEQAREHALAEVEERNDAVVDRIRDELTTPMHALASESPDVAVAALQRLATEVVRPMSHELAQVVPMWQPAEVVTDTSIDWRRVVDGATRGRPLMPFATGVLTALVSITVAIWFTRSAYSSRILVLALVAPWLTLTALNWVIDHWLSRLAPRLRIALVTLLVIAASFGASSIVAAFADEPTVASMTLWGGGAYVTVFAMLLAVIRSAYVRRRVLEEELVAINNDLRWQLARVRGVQWHQQKALARALHGPVQGAVSASAIRLEQAVADGRVDATLLDDTRRAILSAFDLIDVDHARVLPLSVALDRVVATWDGICEITVRAETGVIEALDTDPVASTCVTEIVTEATSNAVRHGKATDVVIVLRLDAPLVEITFVENGRPSATSPARGLGLRMLDDVTVSWSRASKGEAHVLTALLPIMTTAFEGSAQR